MKIEQVKNLSPTERFLYWIQERESIRLKKEAGEPKPWTDDEILQTYKFCNVRRMDDRVSQWLWDNWYKVYKDHQNMLVACVLARYFNLPSTLEAIGFPEKVDLKKIDRTLKIIKSRGNKIFNGAYIVSTNGLEMDKCECVLYNVVEPILFDPPKIDSNFIQKSVEVLTEYWGVSTFMAGQVIADMRWAWSGKWIDKNQWAAIGPGSRRGMNRLQERELKFPLKQDQFLIELKEVVNLCKNKMPSIVKKMEAIDYQNCCCEFDKYERCIWRQGKPKQRYCGI